MRVWLAPHMRTARTGFGDASQRSLSIVALAIAVLGWQGATALALDSAKPNGPAKIPLQTFTSVEEAFQAGVQDLMAGDAQSSVQALTYAADGGQPLAQWKLGRMYARGEGVPRDDVKAYAYF